MVMVMVVVMVMVMVMEEVGLQAKIVDIDATYQMCKVTYFGCVVRVARCL